MVALSLLLIVEDFSIEIVMLLLYCGSFPSVEVSRMCLCDITDLLTVSETATEPPQEEGNNLNSPKNLSLEATFVNHNFSQQVLKIVSCCLIVIK